MNKLIFDQPASCWEEAIPLGNGFLGSMIHGKYDKEMIEMNEDSLWSGGKTERRNSVAGEYIEDIRNLLNEGKVEAAQKLSVRSMFSKTPHSVHYQPLGQVCIEFPNQTQEVKEYQRCLELDNAIFTMKNSYLNDDLLTREAFVSYPDNVMVYKLKTNIKGHLSFDLYLQRRDTRSGKTVSYLDSIECLDHTLYLSGYNGNQTDGINYTMGCRVEVTGGKIKQFGTRLVIEDADEAILYIVGRTSFRSEEPRLWCENHLNEVIQKAYTQLKENHINDYQNLYHQMSLELPDRENLSQLSTPKRLARLKEGKKDPQFISLYFNFARYLLISCSREGSLPANLQGIWAYEFEPSWGSKYTININLQMNYWMAEKVGLSSLHMPLMNFLERMLPRAKETAKNIYQSSGACAHHNTDIWCDSDPMDYNASSTIWPLGYLWLSLHIMEHFQYTRDNIFIDKYLPILKENIQFLLDYLYIDNNGYYATGPSVSPENTYKTKDQQLATICSSPTMDIQIVREFLIQYLDICKITQCNDYVKESMNILEKLPPLQVGKYQQLMEWQEDYEEVELGHRHISHLFGLYPGTQIQMNKTPEIIEAVKNTLKRRLENGGGHTGWSCAWIIHFFARLRDKEKAYDMLMKLLTESTLNNLFDNCPPFQIDGNFGGANGILEMLVQDYKDDVYILPAVTQQLSEGKLENLVLKAGAKISFEWRHCQIYSLKIQAIRTIHIQLDILGKKYTVDLKAGDVYYIKQ